MARSTTSQCHPCPVRAQCTTSRDSSRSVGFPPKELLEPQLRDRVERQEPSWHKRYAVRSGIEGTHCDFTRGHGMRRCRYRGQGKTHLQHVLTAIAVIVKLGRVSEVFRRR
ncbi:transposase [Saccharothrix syringae]|uniref:transposase n=1 Tax=Saccharothrix syringae TaxID=103733 RepID=UPI001B803079|nr:transposase [Saccharothrix syringae]